MTQLWGMVSHDNYESFVIAHPELLSAVPHIAKRQYRPRPLTSFLVLVRKLRYASRYARNDVINKRR